MRMLSERSRSFSSELIFLLQGLSDNAKGILIGLGILVTFVGLLLVLMLDSAWWPRWGDMAYELEKMDEGCL